MKLLGIEFAPLNVPLERRLQTLSVAAWFVVFAFGGFIGLFFALYLIFYTSLWLLTLLYIVWIYIDKDTCEQGGRRIEWVRGWTWWKYFRDYFPTRLVRLPGVKLDPKRNYLFCVFPHGMLSMGLFGTCGNRYGEFTHMFPHHDAYCHTLKQHFYMPFFRELVFAMGGLSASAKAISSLLQRPEGGQVGLLIVGGVLETYKCKPGENKVLLKNRKGFVKMSLKTGAPMVPLYSFGETDLFSQLDSREGSLLRKIQETVRKVIGIAPVILMGRGFFQYSFGIIPIRKPVTVVVGHPIQVEKIENPTQEDIDTLHKTFVDRLVELFESEKHKYLVNADKTHLIIE